MSRFVALVHRKMDDRVSGENPANDDFSPRDLYPLADRIMAEDDANDPALDSYQTYERQSSPSMKPAGS